ncbi:MAG TPA: MGMT family protein, partial [Candidatus Binatia bacterium]|nr:MGMT family protein [Candidatus Binatia bacterium]
MATPPFHREVYRLVRKIPRGRVVTYGQVAAMLGHPRAARAVGTALGSLP